MNIHIYTVFTEFLMKIIKTESYLANSILRRDKLAFWSMDSMREQCLQTGGKGYCICNEISKWLQPNTPEAYTFIQSHRYLHAFIFTNISLSIIHSLIYIVQRLWEENFEKRFILCLRRKRANFVIEHSLS